MVLSLSRVSLLPRGGRRLQSILAPAQLRQLDKYIAAYKSLDLEDTFSVERLSDLYITLPTRDGTRKDYKPPRRSMSVPHGAHLAFFHARTPESKLSEDGTDSAVEFGPPAPFTRRMWASGRVWWDPNNLLLVGEKAKSKSTFGAVEKKGFDTPSPMVFVTQHIDIYREELEQPSIVEERSHVYVAESVAPSTTPRIVKDIPPTSDFQLQFKPTLTTLFRFSALMFNAHLIHLDKDWAQGRRGYPERLVHGPLTALMLLETLKFHHPAAQLTSFEYRARNPIIVGESLTFHGTWTDESAVQLWCVNADGVVGMTGRVTVRAKA